MSTADEEDIATQIAGSDNASSTDFSEASLKVGSVLNGRYVIEREIARGGFGALYLARDKELYSRPVAIKVLLVSDEWSKKKALQEAEALSRINDPCVVQVFEKGRLSDGCPYLVIEYVEGNDLRSLMRPEGIPLDYVAQLVKQMGRALSAAHANGIYHRDLKPANIMLKDLGEGEQHIKIIDFGIASVKNSQVGTNVDWTVVSGTIDYMAPEQIEASPTAASDIYALGVIAYEMVTGKLPFNVAPGPALQRMKRMLERQREGVRVMPKDLRAELPDAAQELIVKALAFDQKERPRRARDFGDQLAAALGSGAEASSDPLKTKPAVIAGAGQVLNIPEEVKTTYLRRAWLMLGASLLAALLIFVLARNWSAVSTREQTLPPLTLYWHGFGQRQLNGRWSEFVLSDGSTLYSGDQFRLAISANEDCYLYVINFGAEGTVDALFPNKKIKIDNPVRRGQQYEIADGTNWFTMNNKTGNETLYLIASYDPLDKLEDLIRKAVVNDTQPSLRRQLDTEMSALINSQSGSENQLRTRSGKLVVRGIGIQPDKRTAETTLASGRQISETMQFEPGAVSVVKRIQIRHESRP